MKNKNRAFTIYVVIGVLALCLAAFLLLPRIDDSTDGTPIGQRICRFEANYIRTNGYHSGREYPVVNVVHSVEELNTYYEANKSDYDLADFWDACTEYDDAYFENRVLVIVLLEEGSGSYRHNVEKVWVENGKLSIDITTLVPEVGTCDMAEWHILIEPEGGVTVDSENDVQVDLARKEVS